MKIDLPELPKEVDDPETLMPAVRKLRDDALATGDMNTVVLLSHVHAWLYWARETIRANDRGT